MASTFPSRVLAAPECVTGLCRSGGGDRVLGVGLAALASPLPVRAVDLDHRDAFSEEMAGQAGAVAAGALDADQLDGPEPAQPHKGSAISVTGGVEALDAQQRAAFVERGDDVHVEMRVDTRSDLECQGGHRHPSLSATGLGGTTPAGSDGQDSDGPLRQAPSKSLRPTGGCRVNARTRPTDRDQDNPDQDLSRQRSSQTRSEHPPAR